MFGLFGFDPGTMSDEELMQKSADLHSRLAWANNFGGGDMITSLRDHLAQIEFEQRDRILRTSFVQMNDALPEIIESDPELANLGKDKEPTTKGKILPQQRPRPLITRSDRPVDAVPLNKGDK